MSFVNVAAPTAAADSNEISTFDPVRGWYMPWKGMMDWMGALALLLCLAPVIVLAALVVKLTSRGPAFYRQTRLGKGGRRFLVIKLRTMVHNAEALTGPVWAKKQDPRVTRFGEFLRFTHVDEFPQLVNVLCRQMSLVGPRPERPEIAHRLEWDLPDYPLRLQVRPGITGLAQVKLPPDNTIEDVRRKLAHDLYYVRHCDPWLDLRILAYTGFQLVAALVGCVWQIFALPSHAAIESTSPPTQNQATVLTSNN